MKFGMCKQSCEYENYTATSALGSSSSGRSGEQLLSSRTRVTRVAPSISNGTGCNKIAWRPAQGRSFLLTAPLYRTYPPTSVGGIRSPFRVWQCRKDLNDPSTAVGGIFAKVRRGRDSCEDLPWAGFLP